MNERTNDTSLIELQNVVKAYETPAGPVMALKEVDLLAERGEFVSVIGKSGSGKSTLINMITGIDRPTSGEVWIDGTPVHELNEEQMARWRGKNLGIVFQFFQMLRGLSLLQNIILPMDFADLYTTKERRERAMYLLELVGLEEQAHKLPSMVSGGQQQRAAIARALANDPAIIVADEPTGSLDSRTAENIFQLFEELVSNGKTILMVTHDNDQAIRASRTVIVSDGKVMNEFIKSALPGLDLEQLLSTSSKFEQVNYAPGELILQKGTSGTHFYIVTKGKVEVLLDTTYGHQIPVAELEGGQFFGEMELIQGGMNFANVRASGDGVEVMRLDKSGFEKMLQESEVTRQAIEEVVNERNAQNRLALEVEHSN